MKTILLVEDERVIRTALKKLLERNAYNVLAADSVEEVKDKNLIDECDLVLADLRLPGAAGTDVIPLAGERPVLIMTSYASVRSAVDAMKQGATDYIAKPFNHDELLLTLKRILNEIKLKRQNAALKSDVAREFPVDGMVGDCPAMLEVKQRIAKVAPTDATVLIGGESGTGKELVARSLHEQSTRTGGPMIALNCAAIPRDLLESELFGHEKGSFTGATSQHVGVVEAADGGTLFLDEIGELSLDAQARLLRVLQEGEIRRVGSVRTRKVDVRLLAATHRDLPSLISNGQFREDLYFRIRVMEIRLPPLRQRGGDIDALASMFLKQHCEAMHSPSLNFSKSAINAIRVYHWPGNVRELSSAIERAVILCDANEIQPEMLALAPPDGEIAETVSVLDDLSLDDYFRKFVETHQHDLTETELAKRLGISRKALWQRRQRMGIQRPKSR